jgi:RNA polymerase sigma-70 factor (ECF subfamily)
VIYPLADLLLERHGSLPGADVSREALEKELEALHEKGRSAWPEVTVTARELVGYLADRVAPRDDDGLPTSPTASDLHAALGKVRIVDLYLACACARGDARAMALFDARYLSEVDRALHSSKLSEAIDETKQVLRRRFFISENGEAPRIANYSGRGDLKAWVRAAAVRAALRVKRRPKGQTEVESHVIRAVAAAGDDLELDYLKRRYLVDFEAALRDAFLALDVRDRNVMRYYYGKGLGIDAIGSLHRVNRSTVARWLNRITASLIETTRKKMMERLGANRAEVSSLVRMLESKIDMSMRAVVGSIEIIDTKK